MLQICLKIHEMKIQPEDMKKIAQTEGTTIDQSDSSIYNAGGGA